MIDTILEKLHLKPSENNDEEDKDKQEYDPYKRPPDLEVARKHAIASKFAKSKMESSHQKEKIDMCPCCGLPIVIEELSICCARSDFNFNGAGIALYFEFIMFAILILLIYGIISGIYNFYYNVSGENCYYANQSETDSKFTCNENLFNMFSLSNRHKAGPDREWTEPADFDRDNGCDSHLQEVDQADDDGDRQREHRGVGLLDPDQQLAEGDERAGDPAVFHEEHREEEELLRAAEDLHGVQHRAVHEAAEPEDAEAGEAGEHPGLVGGWLMVMLLRRNQTKKNQESELIQKELEQEISDLQKQIDYYESNLETSFQFSGVAFLTYNRQKQVDALREFYKVTKFQLMLMQISGLLHIDNPRKFKGQILYVNKAPEPGDILWENLGVGLWDQFFYRVMTNTATVLVLMLCFGIILGVSLGQAYVNSTNSGSETSMATAVAITILGLVASLLISMINIVLGFVIRKFAQIEKHSTLTEFNISVAKKLGIAQFLNTAMITLIVNFTLGAARTNRDQLWINGGLNSDVMLILLTNAIFPLIQVLFDPFYFLRLYKRRKAIKLGSNCNYTQKEANAFFEGPQVDLAKKYAQATKTLMVTFFYIYLLPLGVPIALFSFLLIYWIEKTLLVKRDAKPAPVGDDLAEEMINFYIELVLIVFAVGCVVWEYVVYGEVHAVTYIQLTFAVLYYVLPIDVIFQDFLHVDEAQTRQSYDEKKHTFWDDYDRRNPITMQKALEDWMKDQSENQHMKNQMMMKFYKQQRKNIEERSHNNFKMIQSHYTHGQRNVKQTVSQGYQVIESGFTVNRAQVMPQQQYQPHQIHPNPHQPYQPLQVQQSPNQYQQPQQQQQFYPAQPQFVQQSYPSQFPSQPNPQQSPFGELPNPPQFQIPSQIQQIQQMVQSQLPIKQAESEVGE